MHRALVLSLLVLIGCTESEAMRVDERTFRIDGPGVPGGSEAPNRRLADRLCPKGYRVIDQQSNRGGRDRAIDDYDTTTSWTIRCL
ncbi:MAG: hypothetical protein JO267_08985 [Alphaproteobacteria bacterium]|nr:hypothetical protein [Alphaproteobacteria bacterium]